MSGSDAASPHTSTAIPGPVRRRAPTRRSRAGRADRRSADDVAAKRSAPEHVRGQVVRADRQEARLGGECPAPRRPPRGVSIIAPTSGASNALAMCPRAARSSSTEFDHRQQDAQVDAVGGARERRAAGRRRRPRPRAAAPGRARSRRAGRAASCRRRSRARAPSRRGRAARRAPAPSAQKWSCLGRPGRRVQEGQLGADQARALSARGEPGAHLGALAAFASTVTRWPSPVIAGRSRAARRPRARSASRATCAARAGRPAQRAGAKMHDAVVAVHDGELAPARPPRAARARRRRPSGSRGRGRRSRRAR